MQRIMLKSKLHRASVTATEIDYEGSIAIDEDLLEEVQEILAPIHNWLYVEGRVENSDGT